MTSTQGNPSEVPSSSVSFQDALSERKSTIAFPKASQLYAPGLSGDDDEDEAERALKELNDAIALPAASQPCEQGLGADDGRARSRTTRSRFRRLPSHHTNKDWAARATRPSALALGVLAVSACGLSTLSRQTWIRARIPDLGAEDTG